MKTNQLPPELVEKMYSITSGRPIEKITGTDHLEQDLKYGGQYSKQAIECAKIAVDYSQPFKDELLKWVGLHEEKDQYAKLIEKQRDELVEMLKYISSELESGDTPHLYKIEELINQIDGKE